MVGITRINEHSVYFLLFRFLFILRFHLLDFSSLPGLSLLYYMIRPVSSLYLTRAMPGADLQKNWTEPNCIQRGGREVPSNLKTRNFYHNIKNLNPVQESGVFVRNLEYLFGIPVPTGNLCDKLRRPGNHPGMRERELLTGLEGKCLTRQGGGSHVRCVCL